MPTARRDYRFALATARHSSRNASDAQPQRRFGAQEHAPMLTLADMSYSDSDRFSSVSAGSLYHRPAYENGELPCYRHCKRDGLYISKRAVIV